MKRARSIVVCLIIVCANLIQSQNMPESLSYTQIYSFIDEMANDGLIEVTSAVRPYSRCFIARKLLEVQQQDSLLSKRQKDELRFYMNSYALELDTVPDNWVEWTNRETFNLSLAQPSFHYLTRDKKLKMSVKPILGAQVYANSGGAIVKRWYGAELNMDIVGHVSVWGSIRDNSWNGSWFLKKSKFGNVQNAALLSKSEDYWGNHAVGPYLNNLPGVEYKEATYGGDFSDSKGGISVYSWWGSIAVERENLQWGDAYHCSNIISNHAPAVPMLSLQLTPVRWFQFDYFHAWLNSNVLDSTDYYVDQTTKGVKYNYRPRPKYMAANMFTFKPVRGLSLSFGNSIVYAERTPNGLYFIPIAFYKSLDHLNTKGTRTDNQNSQAFLSLSIRNLKHTHFYGSFFLDEFSVKRLKKSNPEKNPVSYLVGVEVSNWPLKNLSVQAEFMRSYTTCYQHHTPALTYATNGYWLGHYMGDNAQSIYAQIAYKPVRGLDIKLSYTDDTKYNYYRYIYGTAKTILSKKPFAEKTYRQRIFAVDAVYEVFAGCYATLSIAYNHAKGFAPTSTAVLGEDRGRLADGTEVEYTGDELAQYYLNRFSPQFYWGKNVNATIGLSFNF